MPIITLDGPKLDKDQKKELVESFTEAASEVTGIPEQSFIVLLKETDADNVGVGGDLLSEKQKG
jgi:4-oxalocrotonate tautomerase